MPTQLSVSFILRSLTAPVSGCTMHPYSLGLSHGQLPPRGSPSGSVDHYRSGSNSSAWPSTPCGIACHGDECPGYLCLDTKDTTLRSPPAYPKFVPVTSLPSSEAFPQAAGFPVAAIPAHSADIAATSC